MRWRLIDSTERPLAAVPRVAAITLAVALAVQVAWHAKAPRPEAGAAALGKPLAIAWLRAASLGDPIVLAHILTLYLQAFDNQPGRSIPYMELDYDAVLGWLGAALELDPRGQYPLIMATHLYSLVPDPSKQRLMLEFVHQEFLKAPEERWRWLAHAALIAKHRLRDMPLALRYAEDIDRYARSAGSWARQMRIFILEDMGEVESATVLLGGLLASGTVSDPAEIRFLTQRLEALKNVEKSSRPSGFR